MDLAPPRTASVIEWLAHFTARPPTPRLRRERLSRADDLAPALAQLAAEALARDKRLRIVTADDGPLPEISNALDIVLRPLCLVLPSQALAARITLRATLSLLESRCLRDGQATPGPAWTAWRRRQTILRRAWREALAWKARASLIEPPPAGVLDLFPVVIGPATALAKTAPPFDWLLLLSDDHQPLATDASRVLQLVPPLDKRWLRPLDVAVQQALELEVLTQQLAEMELELATVEKEMAAFATRYMALIEPRQRLLERLQAKRRAAATNAPGPTSAAPEAPLRPAAGDARCSPSPEEAMDRSAQQLKKRFRFIAQKIHPDRAANDAERAWRTALMAEANRAYRDNDAAALEAVFERYQLGAPAAPSADTGVGSLTRQLAAVRRRIKEIEQALDRLYGSKLYELFAAARQAAAEGRDLLAEIAARLDAEIALQRRTESPLIVS